MKKIYLLLSLLLACVPTMRAQYSSNRTATTIVADVLAQMPAQSQEVYNKMMSDLSTAGEEGVFQLLKAMNAPGKGNNSQVEYALSGLSHYVSVQGREAERLATSRAYIKALSMVSDSEVKAFIIRQLEIMGKDEAVETLASYLNDKSLSSPAAGALAAIHTSASGKALLKALNSSNADEININIVLGIAKTQMTEAEPALKALLNADNANLQKAVLYALSQTGTKASLPDLAKYAAKAGFTSEKTGANGAYIALIKRVLAQGDVKEARKAADSLIKAAQKAGQRQTREAALEIQIAASPSDALKLLQQALKDSDRDYRNAALRFASKEACTDMYVELLKSLKKTKPEVKTDIINWLGKECEANPARRTSIQNAGIQPLIDELTSADVSVKSATVETLVKTGDPKAIEPLTALLASDDNQTVLLVRKYLASFKGDICTAVAEMFPSYPDAGKIAGLQLLGERKSFTNLNIVLEQINSDSPLVKETAYNTLKDVVSAKDFATVCNMLEKANPAETAPLQQAAAASLTDYPQGKQLETIYTRMNSIAANKQYLYYPVLGATGAQQALEFIAERFASETGTGKDIAFQALIDWKGIEAAEYLYAVFKNSSATAYFDRALNKYIELVSNAGLTGENRRLRLTQALEIAQTTAQKNRILTLLGHTDSYLGMLLAGQYLDEIELRQAAALTVMNIALNNKAYTGKNVEELLNKVIGILDNPDADYQRQAIRKHLTEIPKEEGFVSLFNGKDLTGWKGLVENPIQRAKMKPAELAKAQQKADERMRKDWRVENGLLIFDGTGYDNLCSLKQYGDFEMYVDWNLDPTGHEADAGIYLRGTPQVQIWDIARVNAGAQVGSGGLYNNQMNPSKPIKLADNKLGEWNTFYIKMTDDRVTVKLNDELVVDNVILENYWDHTQPIFPIEQIELQAHGSKVYYRNIYVKELERPKPFELSATEKKEGYRILFDGTNMHQWTGNMKDYRTENGCISLYPSNGHGGNLYTKEEFGDFVFRFEFQLTPGANNGLGIRTPMEGDAAYAGMELQILDNDASMYSDLQPYQFHGSVYGIIPAKRGFLKPIGEWNYQEVIAKGNHIQITLNGTVIVDGDIREAVKNGTPDKQEHPGLFNKRGHIGFLGHGSAVKFRNIRVKELK